MNKTSLFNLFHYFWIGQHPCLQGSSKALATVTAIIDGTGSVGECYYSYIKIIEIPTIYDIISVVRILWGKEAS
jgi:hypothetical protein